MARPTEEELIESVKYKSTATLVILKTLFQEIADENPDHPGTPYVRQQIDIIDEELQSRPDYDDVVPGEKIITHEDGRKDITIGVKSLRLKAERGDLGR